MKTKLLPILAFLISSGIGFGQEPLWQNDSTLIYEFDGVNDSTPKQKKLYTQDFNIRQYITVDFDYNNGWQPTRKTVELQNEDGNSLLITGYVYDEDLQDFRNNWKNEFIYEASGKVAERSTYSWDVMNSIWKYSSKYEYSYNIHGDKILQLQYKGSGQNWVKKEKDTLIYDDNQIIRERITHQWQAIFQYWEKESRLLYFNSEKVTDSLYEYYALNDEWMLDEKTIYTYEDSLLIGAHTYSFEDETWKNLTMTNYDYDQSNHIILNEQYAWYPDLQQWQGLYKFTYVYNFDNLLSKSFSYNWHSEENEWINSRKSNFTYDENRLNIILETYLWNLIFEEFEINLKVFNYFTDVASVDEKLNRSELAVIYPTISNGSFHILAENGVSPLLMEMFATNGKLIKNQSLKPGLNTISVGNPEKGIYILKLHSGNNSQHDKIIIR
ncbi:MAG: T9SS type A sorting domain-containing protein [Bacteroidales bacterium]|nr:T9SS type A sorting domain-containing protein [Bacteroidales bacterium]MCF8344511.1 T9SS type A sorting domain-containing protein [Bacteroidales bacterium]MCF8350779.1 T9SS type A sorting domain-containing protein [Bacteroidales bacterium]MCF8376855.1 T9SS type A sorting domain-containing protein [Bacteroidales bacterium]MCF8401870.1 T9SS type A sorting domain-containing protein [Bacteroidales bacterium]